MKKRIEGNVVNNVFSPEDINKLKSIFPFTATYLFALSSEPNKSEPNQPVTIKYPQNPFGKFVQGLLEQYCRDAGVPVEKE